MAGPFRSGPCSSPVSAVRSILRHAPSPCVHSRRWSSRSRRRPGTLRSPGCRRSSRVAGSRPLLLLLRTGLGAPLPRLSCCETTTGFLRRSVPARRQRTVPGAPTHPSAPMGRDDSAGRSSGAPVDSRCARRGHLGRRRAHVAAGVRGKAAPGRLRASRQSFIRPHERGHHDAHEEGDNAVGSGDGASCSCSAKDPRAYADLRPLKGRSGPERTRPPRAEALRGSREKSRRRPTLPGGLPPSTIGAGGLNCRVRNGNGCFPAAMATGNLALSGAQPPLYGQGHA
jgi:hypothetical protein